MVEVERLAKENRFDYLLIESTGISEPIPVAQTFDFVSEEGDVDLSKFSYVDTMVTVVEALNFFKDFGSADTLIDRDMTDMDDDFRTIVNLLTDQVEFANVIILNKTDLVTPESVGALKAAIHKLSPSAKIITSSFSKVAPSEILNTGLFNLAEAEQSAGWIEELNKEEHTPETLEYGIDSFVFRNQKPFDAERFWSYVAESFPATIIRSKGLFWINSRPGEALSWGQAGGSLRADSAGAWWASMPFSERTMFGSFIENQTQIEQDWHAFYGDRKNELVFIGQDMDKEGITAALESCLATDEEIETMDWKQGYEDSWPIPRMHAMAPE